MPDSYTYEQFKIPPPIMCDRCGRQIVDRFIGFVLGKPHHEFCAVLTVMEMRPKVDNTVVEKPKERLTFANYQRPKI